MRTISSIIAFCCITMSVCVVHAQAPRNVDLQRFAPALDAESFLGVQATTTPTNGDWNLQLSLGSEYRPLMAQVTSGPWRAVLSDRETATLAFQIGFLGRFAIAGVLPIVLWQGAGPIAIDTTPIAKNGMGDPRLVVRYRLLGPVSTDSESHAEGLGLALQIGGTIPVGSSDLFAGESAVRADAALLADFQFANFGVGAMLQYRHRFSEREFLGVEFADEVNLGLAAKMPIQWVRNLVGIVEVRGGTGTKSFFGSTSTVGDGAIAAR